MALKFVTTYKPDYLAFTVGNDTTKPTEVMRFLGLDFRELGWGRYCYKAGAQSEVPGVEVYWDGHQPGMGVHVRISGQGCRVLEEDPFFDWREWLAMVRERFDARFTRADLAIDDREMTVDFPTVLKAVEEGTCVRRGSSWRHLDTFRQGRHEETLYVGSRESTAMLRVYQKGLALGEDRPWLRFEAEWKAERADNWVRLLISEGWEAAVGAIRHCWEFKDPEHVTPNRSRWRAAAWWEKVIGCAKHAFKLNEVAEVTWEKVKNWMVRQWAPTVAVVLKMTGGDISPFLELASIGEARETESHRRLAKLGRSLPAFGFA